MNQKSRKALVLCLGLAFVAGASSAFADHHEQQGMVGMDAMTGMSGDYDPNAHEKMPDDMSGMSGMDGMGGMGGMDGMGGMTGGMSGMGGMGGMGSMEGRYDPNARENMPDHMSGMDGMSDMGGMGGMDGMGGMTGGMSGMGGMGGMGSMEGEYDPN